MTNEEAYKLIETVVFRYEEKDLSPLDERRLNNDALYHIREALNNEPFLIDALNKAHAEIKELDNRIEMLKYELEVYEHNSNLGDEVETRGDTE